MRTIVNVCLATAIAYGMFMQNPPVPVDRLVAYAEQDVSARPADSGAHYRLARIHYLAFALRADVMSPESVRFHSREDGAKKNAITDAVALQHLLAASRVIRVAVAQDRFARAVCLDPSLYTRTRRYLGQQSRSDRVRNGLDREGNRGL